MRGACARRDGEAMGRALWRRTGEWQTRGGSVEEGLEGPAESWLWSWRRPQAGWESRVQPQVSGRGVVCLLLTLFSPALTEAALAPPNALASLCLRNLARLGPPSPKPTSPWSLFQPSLHSLARAASGHTPTPLPGSAVARQPGVRYPAPLGPGGWGQGGWGKGQARGPGRALELFSPLMFPKLNFCQAPCLVRLQDKDRGG